MTVSAVLRRVTRSRYAGFKSNFSDNSLRASYVPGVMLEWSSYVNAFS